MFNPYPVASAGEPVAAQAPARLQSPLHPHLKAAIAQARAQGPIVVAVAYPCDTASITVAHTVEQAGRIVLTSRSDSVASRVASCALAVLVSGVAARRHSAQLEKAA